MKQLKKEVEFLEYAYNQILTEKDTYSFVIRKNKELKERGILNNYLKELIIKNVYEFNRFLISIKTMLKNRNYEINENDLMLRMATYMSLNIEKTTQKEIIKHLVDGSEVVLTNIKENYNLQTEMGKTVNNIYNRFIKFESDLIVNLKKSSNENG